MKELGKNWCFGIVIINEWMSSLYYECWKIMEVWGKADYVEIALCFYFVFIPNNINTLDIYYHLSIFCDKTFTWGRFLRQVETSQYLYQEWKKWNRQNIGECIKYIILHRPKNYQLPSTLEPDTAFQKTRLIQHD